VWAGLATVFLMLTPAHFIHSRLAMDYIYPLPFVLGWLLCMLLYLDSDRTIALAGGAFLLGLGFYSYLASVVLMTLYGAATLAAVWFTARDRKERLHALGFAAAGCAVPIIGVVAWLASHPTMYSDFVQRYNIYPAHLNPIQGTREFLNYTSLTERVYLYWEYFNPSYLFFSGASNIVHATRKAGVFPFAFAVLLPAGLYGLTSRRATTAQRLVLFGFLTAPMAALLIDEPGAIDRELVLLPFAAIVAIEGARQLMSSGRTAVQLLATVLIATIPIQFYFFISDYHGDYRLRSIDWFERNVRGGIERIIARMPSDDARPVYLSAAVPFVDLNWRFYLLKHNRLDLLERARIVDLQALDTPSMKMGSIVFAAGGDPAIAQFLESGRLRIIDRIVEPTGVVSFVLASPPD